MLLILMAELASMIGGLYLLKNDDTDWDSISQWNLPQKIVCLTFCFLMFAMVGAAGWLGLGAEDLEQFDRSGSSVMHGARNLRGHGEGSRMDVKKK